MTIFIWQLAIHKLKKHVLQHSYRVVNNFTSSFIVSFGSYLGNPLSLFHYTLTKIALYSLGSVLTVCHFLPNNEALTITKQAAILLANMKAYSRTAISHIKIECVLTSHKRGLLSLKNQIN